ncbi:hypothetical protein GH714_016499 [Hevea brasiliensis]|uniref:RING-type domain-containing protein n=1 Tax=Hevea brasiliensis TaxID=3981 RepID=A0A6A6LS55_HEVBR|nr:hypothetical protein GH714_016499 [Hevea brasiliensis]
MPAQKRPYETHQKDDDPLQRDQPNNHHELQQSPPGDGDDDVADGTCTTTQFYSRVKGKRELTKFVHFVYGFDCRLAEVLLFGVVFCCFTESDRSPSSSNEEEKEEYVVVKLSEIRKEVQCPICLGIIRKTRTVMECLHRFCRECIDKSMRLGNNECPACRTHCASRRSLRDDPNYDALIAALYPDIDKYEEEELAFHEEEKARNKQIQASIAQTFRRQAEALGRKRTTSKATIAAFSRRTPGRHRDAHKRGRRNYQTADIQGSDDNEDANEVNRESMGSSAGLVGPSERLAWGKGGMRSHTRYGSANAGNGKNVRNSRISKLADYLRNWRKMITSWISTSCLFLLMNKDYLVYRGRTSAAGQLCQSNTYYVALQTALPADEVEIYLVKELNSVSNSSTRTSLSISMPITIDSCKDKLQVLEDKETLAGLKTASGISEEAVDVKTVTRLPAIFIVFTETKV